MPNFIDLPIEFMGLQGQVQWVQKVNENEYTSSCPRCGINPDKHSDENPSDRFIMWLASKSTGKPFAMCYRGCGFKWSPEKHDALWTDEELQEFKRKRVELIERENERVADFAREVVMAQRFYKQYSENLKNSSYGKWYLAERGFKSDEWNRFFGFGIIEDYFCKGFLDNYYSPAITMPIKGMGRLIENIKLRVSEAHHAKDRFRNQYKSKAQHIYLPMGETVISNKVVIIEGEMKSCTVAQRIYGKLPPDVQILATQGNGIGGRMIHALRDCEVVYLCLDPDTYMPNDKGVANIIMNAKKIGYDRTRVIPCRGKVDDAILQGFNFVNAFNMAIKPRDLGLKII